MDATGFRGLNIHRPKETTVVMQHGEQMEKAAVAVAAMAVLTFCSIATMMLYAAFVSQRLAKLEAEAKVLRRLQGVIAAGAATLADDEREALDYMLRHAAWAASEGAFADSGDYRLHHDAVFRIMGR
jgi:hypothetical protein